MGQGIISRSNPGNSGDKVGDIRITTRNTLGDKWALCNGEYRADSEMAIIDPENDACWNDNNVISPPSSLQLTEANTIYAENGMYYFVEDYSEDEDGTYAINIYRYDKNTGQTEKVLDYKYIPDVPFGASILGIGYSNKMLFIAVTKSDNTIYRVRFNINDDYSIDSNYTVENHEWEAPDSTFNSYFVNKKYCFGAANNKFYTGFLVMKYEVDIGFTRYISIYDGSVSSFILLGTDAENTETYYPSLFDINGVPYLFIVNQSASSNPALGTFNVMSYSCIDTSGKFTITTRAATNGLLENEVAGSPYYGIARKNETEFAFIGKSRIVYFNAETNTFSVEINTSLYNLINIAFTAGIAYSFYHNNILYMHIHSGNMAIIDSDNIFRYKNVSLSDGRIDFATCYLDYYRSGYIITYRYDNEAKDYIYYGLSYPALPTISVDDESYCFIKIKD